MSMKYIVISGIDGSGKTTLIEGLHALFGKNNLESTVVWMRYNHFLVKPLHFIARLIGLSNKYPSEDGFVWRHEFYKSTIFCTIYIWATYFDTILGRVKLNFLINGKCDYVICDRWLNDILIDLGTKTKNRTFLNSKWSSLFRKLLPPNSVEFVIQRSSYCLLASRLENREDPEFTFRLELYKSLSKREGIVLIDNNSGVEDAVKSIYASLSITKL